MTYASLVWITIATGNIVIEIKGLFSTFYSDHKNPSSSFPLKWKVIIGEVECCRESSGKATAIMTNESCNISKLF